MMTKNIRYAQSSALPAIAAALALSSTSAWAQEVPASTTDQPTSSAPATTPVDSVPDISTTAAPAPVEVMSTETVAPEAAAAPERKRTTTTTARASTQRATAPTRARSTAPAAAAAAPVLAAAPAAAPALTQPAPQTVASAPQPAPATAQAPAGTTPGVDDETLMLGGGALALLALGGAAVAMRRRRRRHDDEVMADDYTAHEEVVHDPAPEPAPMAVTPRHDPAESWTPAIAAAPAMASTRHHMDRRQGETWVERAHRGPTPDNPSLSLRKRLKRAAFFDARERQVAAGHAEPVATDAGLPDNVAAPATTREREVEFA